MSPSILFNFSGPVLIYTIHQYNMQKYSLTAGLICMTELLEFISCSYSIPFYGAISINQASLSSPLLSFPEAECINAADFTGLFRQTDI